MPAFSSTQNLGQLPEEGVQKCRSWPLLILTFFFFYVYCFSPTLGIPRELIFFGHSYFDPTSRNMYAAAWTNPSPWSIIKCIQVLFIRVLSRQDTVVRFSVRFIFGRRVVHISVKVVFHCFPKDANC